jgi:serine/threonine protein phosphatase PrpC
LISCALDEGIASDMATTLTGILVANDGYRIVHIGNTRAYIKQGKYLKQITSDHTTFNWLMSSGQIEAAEHCNKSEITNCFGGKNPALLSKLYIADCQQFSLALLTSDGVHDYVDLDTLEEILAGEGSYDDKCEEIISRAKHAGSEDDLSVVIICPLEG